MDGLEWMDDIVPCGLHAPCVGMRWQIKSKRKDGRWFPSIYTIAAMDDEYMHLTWKSEIDGHEEDRELHGYEIRVYNNLVGSGRVRLVDDDVNESIKLPVEIGDTVYMGKFKNKKTVVKDVEWNEKGDLMINGKSALRFRIPKKAKKVIKESDDLTWMDEIPSTEPDWNLSNFPLNELDLFRFRVGSSDNLYGFCFDCKDNPNETIIYNTKYPPMEIKFNGGSNGGTWTWDTLRENFLSGHWHIVVN